MDKGNTMITLDELMNEVKTYIQDPDSLALIEKAYRYAQGHHQGQFRRSGEPYMIHAAQVGYILATMKVGPRTICAGLLHDVLEDCGVSAEQMSADFDEEITMLVEGVTKIGNLKFKDEKEYQAANHRKIFIAMANDIRVMVQTVSGTAKTVKMHVLANHDKVNPEANEKISANDFTMDLEDVAEMTDADVIARANAQAWDEEDEFISLSTVEYDIKPQPGTYPATFGTSKGTSITIKISVVEPKYVEDNKHNIGITAFDFYKTPDEIKESVALNTDLKMWASAEAWDLEDDSPIEISEVKYDFDPETITEGDFDITFATKGRIFKIHTTDFQEEGKKVDLKFAPEDIHVMSKMGV